MAILGLQGVRGGTGVTSITAALAWALQLLGETAGVNIVTDESVGGTITLNLKQAGWQEALDVIVRAKNLRTYSGS